MRWFGPAASFLVQTGRAPIAVGAPHHGTRPGAGSDLGTAPIALQLASTLEASAVAISDVRRMADVNKDPLRLKAFAREYALRYQNELFRAGPRLVVEIHGHQHGRYEVEIATGFDLDPALPGDALYLERLLKLKRALAGALLSSLGRQPSVGIYPLDRDVEETATATFTFQKIRRARNLAGVELYGLHVELGPALRIGGRASSPSFVESLAGALATAIRAGFVPLPEPGAVIPVREVASGAGRLLAPQRMNVARVPARYVYANAVVVHPDDLERLRAVDGDEVLVCHGDEELHSQLASSPAMQPGHAALSARLRHQLGVDRGGWVIVGRPATSTVQAPLAASGAGCLLVREVRETREREVWLAPEDLGRLGLGAGELVIVQGRPSLPLADHVLLSSDTVLPRSAAAVSHRLMDHLLLTLGEVIAVRASE